MDVLRLVRRGETKICSDMEEVTAKVVGVDGDSVFTFGRLTELIGSDCPGDQDRDHDEQKSEPGEPIAKGGARRNTFADWFGVVGRKHGATLRFAMTKEWRCDPASIPYETLHPNVVRIFNANVIIL
jgi:hypothetical protein